MPGHFEPSGDERPGVVTPDQTRAKYKQQLRTLILPDFTLRETANSIEHQARPRALWLVFLEMLATGEIRINDDRSHVKLGPSELPGCTCGYGNREGTHKKGCKRAVEFARRAALASEIQDKYLNRRDPIREPGRGEMEFITNSRSLYATARQVFDHPGGSTTTIPYTIIELARLYVEVTKAFKCVIEDCILDKTYKDWDDAADALSVHESLRPPLFHPGL